jgi:hypothetical protein
MSRILSISLLFILLTFCKNNKEDSIINSDSVNNSQSADGSVKVDLPELKFNEEVFDFGKITQGEKVSHSFIFKNIGSKNLIISGANGSCGCTVPEWPKEPIKAGTESKINVVFSSEGKSGMQEKTVTIVTNCEPATRIIKIKAEVIVPETAK